MSDEKDIQEVFDGLDHRTPEFIDPETSDEDNETEERINIMTPTFVPYKRKANSKVSLLNFIKLIVWGILLPYACEMGLTYILITKSGLVLELKWMLMYMIMSFALQCIITLWIDWIMGNRDRRKKRK